MDKFDLFLSKMKLMSIAVLVESLPYCSNAFYAYDKDNKTLIFSGHEDSTHIKALFTNRFVSGTIALDTKIISRIKGIQFKGKIRSADENEAKIYFKRFAVAKAMNPELFAIRLDWMKLTDNVVTFGKKRVWERKKEE